MKDTRTRKNYTKKGTKGGELLAVTVNDQFAHIEPVQAQPLEVHVYHNNFDKALRAFRALLQKERTLSSYKERQRYEKPSDKKRRKKNEAIRARFEVEAFNNSEKKKPRRRRKIKSPETIDPQE